MDDTHFDQIARSLATSSRRYALRALGGGALAGLLTRLGLEGATAAACVKPGKKGCKGPKKKKCCQGAKCKGGSKRKAGKCVCTGNMAQCGTTCVDTQTDAQHCGGCDQPCGEGRVCARGDCVCSASLTPCGTACVDTKTDRRHCGGCDQPCDLFQKCTAGECHDPPPVNCFPPAQPCNGSCVDLDTDPNNCGSCGWDCATGLCANGQCRCPAGTTMCGFDCVNTDNHDDHCGACSNRCSRTATCIDGTCVEGPPMYCAEGADTCGPEYYDAACGPEGSACACFQTASGQTRCGSLFTIAGSLCGGCSADTDCAKKYPGIDGVFCASHGTRHCYCAGSTRCQAPC